MGVESGVTTRAENCEILRMEEPFQNTGGKSARLSPCQRSQEGAFKTMTNGPFLYPEASLWAGILNVSSNELDMKGIKV